MFIVVIANLKQNRFNSKVRGVIFDNERLIRVGEQKHQASNHVFFILKYHYLHSPPQVKELLVDVITDRGW